MATIGLDFAALDRLAAEIAARPARVVDPGINQPPRPGPHPWVARMIAAGELDFLDRIHLRPGEREQKMKEKPLRMKPAWLAKKPSQQKLKLR